MGFSRQEYWSRVPLPSRQHVCCTIQILFIITYFFLVDLSISERDVFLKQSICIYIFPKNETFLNWIFSRMWQSSGTLVRMPYFKTSNYLDTLIVFSSSQLLLCFGGFTFHHHDVHSLLVLSQVALGRWTLGLPVCWKTPSFFLWQFGWVFNSGSK